MPTGRAPGPSGHALPARLLIGPLSRDWGVSCHLGAQGAGGQLEGAVGPVVGPIGAYAAPLWGRTKRWTGVEAGGGAGQQWDGASVGRAAPKWGRTVWGTAGWGLLRAI